MPGLGPADLVCGDDRRALGDPVAFEDRGPGGQLGAAGKDRLRALLRARDDYAKRLQVARRGGREDVAQERRRGDQERRPVAGDGAYQPGRVGGVRVTHDRIPPSSGAMMFPVRPKLWKGGRQASMASPWVAARASSPSRAFVIRFRWLNGTALGALSDPEVNRTTAGSSASTARHRLEETVRSHVRRQECGQGLGLADPASQVFEEHVLGPGDFDPQPVDQLARRDHAWSRGAFPRRARSAAGPVVQLSITGSLPAMCRLKKTMSTAAEAGSITPIASPGISRIRLLNSRVPTSSLR